MKNLIFAALTGAFGSAVALLLLFFIYPEKFEKWVSIICRFAVSIFHFGEKRYAAYDIQGRVNLFVLEMQEKSPKISSSGVKIVWVDEATKESPLRQENRLVVRMRRHEDQDKNFLQASMVFIATEFMRKTKKYLSKSQSESLDVFFANQLFSREKAHLADKFFDEYFAPATQKTNVAKLLHKYGIVERVGLFFPILVQELEHLGEKVFFNPKKDTIMAEVNKFIDYLEKYSHRKVGDEVTPTVFNGSYLRCGIVIIAKKFKRIDGHTEPYVNHIGKLLGNKVETIYLIGSSIDNNTSFMDQISDSTCKKFNMELMCQPEVVDADIKDSQGERHLVRNYVVSLRSQHIQRVYDEEYQELYIDDNVASESDFIESPENVE